VEGAVYLLCAVTALACAVLLLRGFRRSRVRLLLWCGLFFLGLFTENVLLFVDVIVVPKVDLSGVRNSVALAGTALLLYGLVWDVR
jgi:hypothetical protein